MTSASVAKIGIWIRLTHDSEVFSVICFEVVKYGLIILNTNRCFSKSDWAKMATRKCTRMFSYWFVSCGCCALGLWLSGGWPLSPSDLCCVILMMSLLHMELYIAPLPFHRLHWHQPHHGLCIDFVPRVFGSICMSACLAVEGWFMQKCVGVLYVSLTGVLCESFVQVCVWASISELACVLHVNVLYVCVCVLLTVLGFCLSCRQPLLGAAHWSLPLI